MADKTKSGLFRLLCYYRKAKDFQGQVRLHIDTAKGSRDVWNGTVQWKRPPHAPHSPCGASLPSTDVTSWQLLFPVKKPQHNVFSAPPLYIETHVLKADFKLLKADKSEGRTCTVAKTFGYYSELEAARVG